jgi:MFS family permease
VTDGVGDRRTSNLGFALLLVAFSFAAFSRGWTGAAGLLVFFSLGLTMVNASIPSLISSLAPENLRGTVLGTASSLESLSGIIMPVVSTYTLQNAGVLPTTAISFGFVALALAMGLILQSRDPLSLAAKRETA